MVSKITRSELCRPSPSSYRSCGGERERGFFLAASPVTQGSYSLTEEALAASHSRGCRGSPAPGHQSGGGRPGPSATPFLGSSNPLSPQQEVRQPQESRVGLFWGERLSLPGILCSKGSIRPFPWVLSLWVTAPCFPGTGE